MFVVSGCFYYRDETTRRLYFLGCASFLLSRSRTHVPKHKSLINAHGKIFCGHGPRNILVVRLKRAVSAEFAFEQHNYIHYF